MKRILALASATVAMATGSVLAVASPTPGILVDRLIRHRQRLAALSPLRQHAQNSAHDAAVSRAATKVAGQLLADAGLVGVG